MHRLTRPYEEWEVLFRQQLQVERAALRRVAGLDDRMSTGVTAEPDTGALGHAVAAVAGAALRGRRGAPPPRGRADLPMPDAHVETRYPKAA